jgi:predicted nucleic acid-binding protein
MSILLEEDRKHEAREVWNKYEIKVSSVLLKIETSISLLRFFNRQNNKFDKIWLANKKVKLMELLNNIFFNDITESFANMIVKNNELASCKSLDAIHIATALNIRNNPNNKNIHVCSFDNKMLMAAKKFGFKVN